MLEVTLCTISEPGWQRPQAEPHLNQQRTQPEAHQQQSDILLGHHRAPNVDRGRLPTKIEIGTRGTGWGMKCRRNASECGQSGLVGVYFCHVGMACAC